MKASIENLSPILESAIIESLRSYESNNDGNFLGDLYFRFEENAKFSIYDDMENLLNEIVLEEDQTVVSQALRHILQKFEQEHFFDKDYITKPFTISLIDDDFIAVEELIFIDDDTLKLEDDLWNSLDKELDNFLKDLMK